MKRFGMVVNRLILLGLGMFLDSAAMDNRQPEKRTEIVLNDVMDHEKQKGNTNEVISKWGYRHNRFAKEDFLPAGLYGEIPDSEAENYGQLNNDELWFNQIVLIKVTEKIWKFAKIEKLDKEKGLISVSSFDKKVSQNINFNDLKSFKILRPWYQCLWQPMVPTKWFCDSINKAFQGLYSSKNSFLQGFIAPGNAKIAVIGDLHGDLKSLQHNLLELFFKFFFDSNLKLFQDHYLVFLGDYGDRGEYGSEVYYIISQLKMINKDQVYVLRGNHENPSWVMDFRSGGLYNEIGLKYGLDSWNLLVKVFDSFPSILLAGLKTPTTQYYSFVQFCHGGIDPSLDLKPHLKNIIMNKHYCADLSEENFNKVCWLDFKGDQYLGLSKDNMGQTIDPTTPHKKQLFDNELMNRPIGNMSLLRDYFDTMGRSLDWRLNGGAQFELACLIRGHEHFVPGGAARLLDGDMPSWKPLTSGHEYHVEKTAYTFIACPFALPGVWNYTYAILKAAQHGQWYLTAYIEPAQKTV